jgi:flagellar export protein FliJ
MNAFRFRLQRVLDFRRVQFQLAESEYHQAEARLRGIQAQYAALAAKKSETRISFTRLPIVSGRILEPLTYWFQWTETEALRLAGLEKALALEVRKRREALVEAQRKVRLLEKLRENRHLDWKAGFDREIEELAADSTNSRYARDRLAEGRD